MYAECKKTIVELKGFKPIVWYCLMSLASRETGKPNHRRVWYLSLVAGRTVEKEHCAGILEFVPDVSVDEGNHTIYWTTNILSTLLFSILQVSLRVLTVDIESHKHNYDIS